MELDGCAVLLPVAASVEHAQTVGAEEPLVHTRLRLSAVVWVRV